MSSTRRITSLLHLSAPTLESSSMNASGKSSLKLLRFVNSWPKLATTAKELQLVKVRTLSHRLRSRKTSRLKLRWEFRGTMRQVKHLIKIYRKSGRRSGFNSGSMTKRNVNGTGDSVTRRLTTGVMHLGVVMHLGAVKSRAAINQIGVIMLVGVHLLAAPAHDQLEDRGQGGHAPAQAAQDPLAPALTLTQTTIRSQGRGDNWNQSGSENCVG